MFSNTTKTTTTMKSKTIDGQVEFGLVQASENGEIADLSDLSNKCESDRLSFVLPRAKREKRSLSGLNNSSSSIAIAS